MSLVNPYTPPYACCLSKLSVDVFSIIAPFLSTSDIKAARLSGREFYFFLTPYLFRSVTFAPFQHCLDILNAIAQNPVLSYNTKTLYFDCTVFRLPNEIDEFDRKEFPPEYVPRFRSWRSSSKAVYETEDRIQQAQHFVTYSKFAFEHMAIRHNLESHLSSVLLMFPKINTITLTNTFKTQTSGFKYALQTDTIARLWVRTPQFISIIRAISNHSQSTITKIGTEGRMVETQWTNLSNSDFGDDSNILGSARNCIRDFETGTYPSESMPTILSSAFDIPPSDLSIARSIFHNLTHLNLALSSTTEPAGGFDIGRPTKPLEPCWIGLSKVLSALVNVSDLSLDFKVRRAIDQQLTWWYFEDDLEEIFEDPQLTFPHLRTLSLVRFRSTAKSLASLLHRHSAIVNLKLHHVIQTCDDDNSAFSPWSSSPTTGWVQVAELMKKMRLLRLGLRNVEGFRNGYTLPGREFVDLLYPRLYDYILHGYGANPLVHGRLNDEWDKEFWGEPAASM